MGLLTRRPREPTSIAVGRISGADNSNYISPYKSVARDLLQRLRRIDSAAEAIRLLSREHPDMSMAVGNLVYLSNQGHTIEFHGPNGKRFKEAEDAWRDFCRRVYADSAAGLDGLIDALHRSSYTRSGMAFEVVVTEDGGDIEDVYLIDPMSIHWEVEERNGKKQFVPYQYCNGSKIDLSKGNFFWIPFDPDVWSPAGNLMLQSAIQAIDHQLELYQSLDTVLYRIGVPRYDVSVDTQLVAEGAPLECKGNPQKMKDFLTSMIEEVRKSFTNIGPKNDFVHSGDMTVNCVGGGSSMSGVDARSFKEISDTEVLNGTQQLGVMMNRYDSKTNALSSTEFKIMVNKIDARRRDSKRAIETIANIWLRVHGYNATAAFTHNPIEWETLIDKYSALLKKMELYRRAEEYGYIGPDEAAQDVMGKAKAFETQKGKEFRFFEYIKKKFSLLDIPEVGSGGGLPGNNEEKDDDSGN